MECLLFRLKSQSVREASLHPAFMGICPTISHALILFTSKMSSFFGSWCSWTKQLEGWVNIKFYLFVSGINQVEWEREVSRPRGWRASTQTYRECGWFLFYCELMLLWVMVVGFDNTCTVFGKWNVYRVIPRLYGWLYKTLIIFP